MTVTFDMEPIRKALWCAFQSSIVQKKKRRRTACGIEYDIIQQCIAGTDIVVLADTLIDSYVAELAADDDIAVEQISSAKATVSRLLREYRIIYLLAIKSLSDKFWKNTGRITNGDSIYQARAAAMPTPPTNLHVMGGVI